MYHLTQNTSEYLNTCQSSALGMCHVVTDYTMFLCITVEVGKYELFIFLFLLSTKITQKVKAFYRCITVWNELSTFVLQILSTFEMKSSNFISLLSRATLEKPFLVIININRKKINRCKWEYYSPTSSILNLMLSFCLLYFICFYIYIAVITCDLNVSFTI